MSFGDSIWKSNFAQVNQRQHRRTICDQISYKIFAFHEKKYPFYNSIVGVKIDVKIF